MENIVWESKTLKPVEGCDKKTNYALTFTVGCYRDGKHKHKGVEAGGGGGEEVGCHGRREGLGGDLQVSPFILNPVSQSHPTFAGPMCLRRRITP